ncbi:MAG TPA: hypothetical protein VGM68_04540 [Rhizomicrobium sp.]
MKILAIASPTPALNPDTLAPHMPKEVPATLQHYLDGAIEQFWFRDKKGPVFLMNAETVEQAQAVLDTLPLVAAKLMTYELLPVGPLLPLGRLIQK